MGAFYLIAGNEEFSIKERANALMRELCGENPEDNPDLEIIRGDNETEKFQIPLDRLMESLETPSFLSPQKIIWLKHFNKFEDAFDESSTKKKPSRIDLLAEILKNGLAADTTLIVDCIGLDRRKSFYKVCDKVCESSGGKSEWFEKADPKQKGALAILLRRIREYAFNAGKRMDDEAAACLADMTGSNMVSISTEIDKLVSYVGENNPVITAEDCRQICSRSAETISWEFSSALSERNPSAALQLIPGIIDTMMAEKGSSSRPEMAIVGAVNKEFTQLLILRCEGEKLNIPDSASSNYFYSLFEEKKDSSESPLFAMHPFRAYKMWEKCTRFSTRELAMVFQYILGANQAMVSGADARLTLENLVLNIAGSSDL